jgi:hypothetical protein
MITIIHKIRLLEGVSPQTFEKWVQETDYATCPKLSSLVSFSVYRVSDNPSAPFHFFEVIQIKSKESFEKDMLTPDFQSLVERFSQMATVEEEVQGSLIEPGYHL